MSRDTPRIAIVGGGPAGAICAWALSARGHRPVVLDKARGAGGRLSSRRSPHGRFDHGASAFTVRDARIRVHLARWRSTGQVALWEGPFVRVGPSGIEPVALEPRWVPTPTMNTLIKHLLADVDVRFGVRVTEVSRAEGGWRVTSEDGAQQVFDTVFVATPAPQAVPLLQAVPDLAEAAASVELSPCWAAMLQVEEGALSFSAARVAVGPLHTVIREHTKPGRTGEPRWVVHAGVDFSTAHLEHDPASVARALSEAAAETFDVTPRHAVAHRWRYARVQEPIGVPCLLSEGLGVCGDGLIGGRVEDALLSGLALADRWIAERADGA